MSLFKPIVMWSIAVLAISAISTALLAQTPAPSIRKPRIVRGSQWQACGRDRHAIRRSSGFTGDTTGTYIREILVDIHANDYSTVTLNWANGNFSSETLPIQFNASPGAGSCAVDCRSIAQSHKAGSHCTPLSPPTYLIQGYDCALIKYPQAKLVSWFDWDREIAFHAYSVPPYPASHGCVRLLTKDRGAEWIYDNSLAGITQVKINWDENSSTRDSPFKRSPKCWDGDRLIPRQNDKSKL